MKCIKTHVFEKKGNFFCKKDTIQYIDHVFVTKKVQFSTWRVKRPFFLLSLLVESG